MAGRGRKITVKVARSASTGRFVKRSYARAHKRTTVVETIKRSVKK